MRPSFIGLLFVILAVFSFVRFVVANEVQPVTIDLYTCLGTLDVPAQRVGDTCYIGDTDGSFALVYNSNDYLQYAGNSMSSLLYIQIPTLTTGDHIMHSGTFSSGTAVSGSIYIPVDSGAVDGEHYHNLVDSSVMSPDAPSGYFEIDPTFTGINLFVLDTENPTVEVTFQGTTGEVHNGVHYVNGGDVITLNLNFSKPVYIDSYIQSASVFGSCGGAGTAPPSSPEGYITSTTCSMSVPHEDFEGVTSVEVTDFQDDSGVGYSFKSMSGLPTQFNGPYTIGGFLVDTTVTVPTLSDPTSGETVSRRQTIRGSSEPYSYIVISHAGVVSQVQANSSGVWSYTPSVDYPEGEFSLILSQRDRAGNGSASSTTQLATRIESSENPSTQSSSARRESSGGQSSSLTQSFSQGQQSVESGQAEDNGQSTIYRAQNNAQTIPISDDAPALSTIVVGRDSYDFQYVSSFVTSDQDTSETVVVDCPYFTKYLERGDQDSEVSKLQSFLKEIGFYSHAYITTYFGSYTETAVKDFQTAYAPYVLYPWGASDASGRFYKTTRALANKLVGCAEGEIKLENGTEVTY